MEFLDVFGKGGPVVVAIALLSLVGLMVFLERLWSTRLSLVFPTSLAAELLELLREGKLEQAEKLVDKGRSALAVMVRSGLVQTDSREEMKTRMEERGAMEVASLARYTGVLSTVSTLAPLLGLLGTVTGMVQVFKAVEVSTEPQIGELAGGIWEALLTTATGLTVAIPALIAFKYLESRVDRIAVSLESYGLYLLDRVHDKNTEGSEQ